MQQWMELSELRCGSTALNLQKPLLRKIRCSEKDKMGRTQIRQTSQYRGGQRALLSAFSSQNITIVNIFCTYWAFVSHGLITFSPEVSDRVRPVLHTMPPLWLWFDDFGWIDIINQFDNFTLIFRLGDGISPWSIWAPSFAAWIDNFALIFRLARWWRLSLVYLSCVPPCCSVSWLLSASEPYSLSSLAVAGSSDTRGKGDQNYLFSCMGGDQEDGVKQLGDQVK